MNNSFTRLVENKWTWVLGVIGIILLCFFAIPIITTQFSSCISFNQQSANIGSSIGGIVSPSLALIGIILTFGAFYIQYKANLIQTKNFHLQQFESKFFDLLKIHRENVSEMTLHNKKQRNVFVILRAEFQDVYKIVEKHTSKIDDKSNQIKADISYLFLFYGIGLTTSPILRELLKKYKIDDAITKIDTELRTIQNSGTSETKHLKEYNYGEKSYHPFNGHQIRLAHYHRHLYQTVKFVELEREFLTEEQKQFYIKTLRAQLGTHEIALFFYNSISSLGKAWREKDYLNLGVKVDLVTKYEIIKNLPLKYFTYELSPKDFYPLINYEWDEIISD